MNTPNITAFVVTTSAVQLVVSYTSASVLQLAAWDQMWRRVLGGISAAPAASGGGA